MITMTNDKDVTLIIDIVLRGEKYLNEHKVTSILMMMMVTMQ